MGGYGVVGPPPLPSQIILGIPYESWKTPPDLAWYILIAVENELYYCCVDFAHTVWRCCRWSHGGCCWRVGNSGGAAAASTRVSCSLWIPSIAYLLGGLSAGIIYFVLWNHFQGPFCEADPHQRCRPESWFVPALCPYPCNRFTVKNLPTPIHL